MQPSGVRARRGGWRALTWLDARANGLFGSRYNPLYQSGAIVVALLAVLLATGLYLLLFYRLGAPWASVARITDQAFLGRWIRGLHRFASDAAVVAAAVHALRMFVQDRSWGPRALAWVSGLALVAAILVCGWTGLVMVWDTPAQVLAMEGARLLDALPIFSEPIGRAFVGERPLPSAFFFLNLFAHIALPIGVGLLVWLHVARVARPVLLPPKRLLWAVVGGLTALAVLRPLWMAPQADLLRLPGETRLDFFYAFWLPLVRGVPAWTVWAAGVALVGAVVSVPLWARPARSRRPARSLVNERLCTGCEQCMLDCPYGAISMVPRTDGRPGLVARVNQDLCVSCGICIGSCAPMGVGPGRTGRDQLAAARAFAERAEIGRADVVVLGCEWSAAGVSPGALAGAHLFPVPCAGNVHTSVIEYLVRRAGGVVVAACRARDCRGREGATWLEQRVHHGREAELQERVDRRRVRIVHASAGEARLLRDAVRGFAAEMAELRREEAEEALDVVALCRAVGADARSEGAAS
ncbi:MAG TPA: hydrogenase iron-sulfur subunit [Longimicrobiales bacterium]|nr:hydrogenase iron-sulfur subunit [Longimicrobiales bacterium]